LNNPKKEEKRIMQDKKMSRREAMVSGGALALAFLGRNAFAQVPTPAVPSLPLTLELDKTKMPLAPYYYRSKEGEGVIGPFGEVRVESMEGQVLPVRITGSDGSVMDFTQGKAFVRFGKEDYKKSIKFTSGGVAFEGKKEEPWSKAVYGKLIGQIKKDRKKIRGLMLLRSALYTSYPVAVAHSKSKQANKNIAKRMAKGARDYGADASGKICLTTQPAEVVEECKVIDFQERWKTAEEQYWKCYQKEYDKAFDSPACKFLPVNGPVNTLPRHECAGAAARVICGAKNFVDILLEVIEILECVWVTIVPEVTICLPKEITPGRWPSPWSWPDFLVGSPVPQVKQSFGKEEIKDGIDLLKALGDVGKFIGEFDCLLDGTWSLDQLDTKLDLGGEDVVIPYGVKVCISEKCTKKLSNPQLIGAALAAAAGLLPVLAALSPDVAGMGITASPAVALAIATAGQVAVVAAALILAVIIFILYHLALISAQLALCSNLGTLTDGKVCISHPTFALALVAFMTQGMAPVQSIPPIVDCYS
jgi:hypothetical protein